MTAPDPDVALPEEALPVAVFTASPGWDPASGETGVLLSVSVEADAPALSFFVKTQHAEDIARAIAREAERSRSLRPDDR